MARRPLHTIEVETTSRCTAASAASPRAAPADRWSDGYFPPQWWKSLRPGLVLARCIHFQGWGEPLLHPGLRAMAADAHAAGGIDVLTVSISGVEVSGTLEAVQRVISIRWDGRVAPCRNLNLPVEGPIPRRTVEGESAIDAPVLGHLADNSLSESANPARH